MNSDKVDNWDTFDGFGIALGGLLRHILAKAIKVIGNSFLILGLLSLTFWQFL